MKKKWFKFPTGWNATASIVLGAMIVMGAYLLNYSYANKPFSEEQLIWDALWLDAWAMLFFVTVIVIWCVPIKWRVKAPLFVGLFSLYGLITVSLLLDGTPFGFNGCWGDQKFRTTMVLKFATWFMPGDFFYKELPAFYPPIYYYLLGLISHVFSIEAFRTIKVGSQLIYLCGPFILYYLWQRLVSGYRAFLIVLATFLFCTIEKVIPLSAPHAFIANALFIPWWLYYIEQIRRPAVGWRYYLTGGLLGSVIFMIYYYPFFIGGLLLVLRLTLFRKWTYLHSPDSFRLKPAMGVLLSSALFSAPFWLPLLISMFVFGNNAAQQEWHHMGSVGIVFKYQSFSYMGLIFLVSIYFVLRRRLTKLNRGLLLLLGTVSLFYLLGTFMGAIGKPINLIKSSEFLLVLAGAFIGLAVATVLRASLAHVGRGKAGALIIVAIFPIFLNGFNRLIQHPMIKTARTTNIPSWGLDKDAMVRYSGSVFLTTHEELFAFHPVYTFIAHNQHYSHPASQYIQRYRFLHNLQAVHNPYLFNLALRHNRFDPVDFFMPRVKDGAFEILLSLSNYPNRYAHQTLRYDLTVVSDTAFFKKEQGDHLYRVLNAQTSQHEIKPGAVVDGDLNQMMRLRMLYDDLDSTGSAHMEVQIGSLWSNWHSLISDIDKADFDNRIELLDAYAVPEGDSIHLIMAFYAANNFYQDFRVFMHVYPGQGESSFDNFDFVPSPRIKTWKKGDMIICMQTIPYHEEYDRIHLGFFRDEKRLGNGVWLQLEG